MTSDLVSTDIDLAVRLLAAGGLVALPTETVYGLAADADHPTAVRRVFEVKGRPADHPLIVHLATAAQLPEWGIVDDRAAAASRLWPGPLTLVLPRTARVDDVVTGGRPTVGVRVPQHAMTLEVLDRLGGAVAAPSANRFGRVSPTTAGHVLTDLGELLTPGRDLVLDGGPARVGVESSILDLSVHPAQLLRAGALGAAELAEVIGEEVVGASGPSRASGMLASHYAPSCSVEVAADTAAATRLAAQRREDGCRVLVLDAGDDLPGAARSLYDDLRRADALGVDVVVAVLPPGDDGLAAAIRDRLTKAAAERSGPSRAR